MPLSANTATVQILDDSSSHVIAKLLLFQHTAGVESDVLKINVNSLVGRTMTLTAVAAPTNGFHAGEAVSNGSTIGYVSDWNAGNKKMRVVLANSAMVFANNAVINGARGSSFTVTNDGANLEAPLLSLRSLVWSVSGNSATRVALQWEGTPNSEIIAVGQGSGYIGRNVLSTQIPNDATSPTGSICLSTYNVPALGGYSLILECSKVKGFDTRPIG